MQPDFWEGRWRKQTCDSIPFLIFHCPRIFTLYVWTCDIHASETYGLSPVLKDKLETVTVCFLRIKFFYM